MDLYDCVLDERYLIRGYTLKNNNIEWYLKLYYSSFAEGNEIVECKILTKFYEIVSNRIKDIYEKIVSFDQVC